MGTREPHFYSTEFQKKFEPTRPGQQDFNRGFIEAHTPTRVSSPFHCNKEDPRQGILLRRRNRLPSVRKADEQTIEIRNLARSRTALARPQNASAEGPEELDYWDDEYDVAEYQAGDGYLTPYGFTLLDMNPDEALTLDLTFLNRDILHIEQGHGFLRFTTAFEQFFPELVPFRNGNLLKIGSLADVPRESDMYEQLSHLLDILCDTVDYDHRARYLQVSLELCLRGEDPDWNERYEREKETYLERDYREPWERRDNDSPGRRDRFYGEEFDVDPSNFISSTTTDSEGNILVLQQYEVEHTPEILEEVVKTKKSDPIVAITIAVWVILDRYDREVERRPFWNPYKEEELPRGFRVRLRKVTTNVAIPKDIARQVPRNGYGLYHIIHPRLNLEARRALMKTVAEHLDTPEPPKVMERRTFAKPFHQRVPIPGPFKFSPGWGWEDQWEILDKNWKDLRIKLYQVKDIKDRKTRFEFIEFLQLLVDAGHPCLRIRGFYYTPWDTRVVKLAVPVPDRWRKQHPKARWVTFELHEKHGVKNWLSRQIMDGVFPKRSFEAPITSISEEQAAFAADLSTLKKVSTAIYRVRHGIKRLKSDLKTDRQRDLEYKLSQLTSGGRETQPSKSDAKYHALIDGVKKELELIPPVTSPKLTELQGMLDVLLQKSADLNARMPKGSKLTERDLVIAAITIMPPTAKVPCLICGQRIKRARLQLAHDLNLQHIDPSHALTTRCVKRRRDRKTNTLHLEYCDRTDVALHSMC